MSTLPAYTIRKEVPFNLRTKTALMRATVVTLFIISCLQSMGQQAVGTWREHLPYNEAIDVIDAGDRVFCATNFAVFAFNKTDQSLTRYSKVNLLSGSDISSIGFDQASQTLLVGYKNGVLDIISNGLPYNLSDIAQSNLIGDKAIYDITVAEGMAYLSCGFGIVVINFTQREVADTWFINGQTDLVQVNSIDYDELHWYAATEKGIYRAERSNPFLVSFEAWELLSDVPIEDAEYTEIAVYPSELLIVRENGAEDEIWIGDKESLNWTLFPGWETADVKDVFRPTSTINVAGSDVQMVLSTENRVTVFDEDWQELAGEQNVAANSVFPRSAVIDEGGFVWVANRTGGLLSFDFGGVNEASYVPQGPPAFNVRRIDAYNDNIWVASGGVDATWTNNYDKKGVFGLVNDQWIHVPGSPGENDIVEINDYMAVSIDPTDNNRVMLGSWEEGLVEIKNGVISEIYNQTNSPLELANFGGSMRIGVGGVDFDQNGNLWYGNAYTNTPLQVFTAGGDFVSYNFQPEVDSDIFIGDIVASRQGYVWAILPRGHGILVFNHNETLSNTSDDSYRVLTNEEGEGGLPTMDIYALEEDLDGEMWVGTLQGIAVFFTPEAIFSENNFDAQQILIEQDGNIQILLETEQVNCIEIDGANRKWVGTANSGVFLLSPDGLERELHFTESNSPLLSNNVTDIAINQRTGEVFFATDRGIVSYTSTATNFDQEIEEITVYPNPVREDFDGYITIDGLAYQSDVKITDTSGNLVYSTTSNGGRAVWDGTGSNGQRVGTGIYLVFATTTEGDAANVAKVAIIR